MKYLMIAFMFATLAIAPAAFADDGPNPCNPCNPCAPAEENAGD